MESSRWFDDPDSTPPTVVVLGEVKFGNFTLGGISDGEGVASVSRFNWLLDGILANAESSPVYALKVGDIGKALTFQVTYTTSSGKVNTLTSTPAVVSERVLGTESSDAFLAGGPGNDALNGLGGLDTAWYAGNRAEFTVQRIGSTYSVVDTQVANGDEGADTLTSVERLRFSDAIVALDISGNAGQTYRLYQAAFARQPDAVGLKYWINQMDAGMVLETVSANFVGSTEFKNKYGTAPSNEALLLQLYQNILHRAPDDFGYNWWLGQMNAGNYTRPQVLLEFSESKENQVGTIGSIQNGIELIL